MFEKLRLWSKKDPDFMDINPEHQSLKKVLCWRVITVIVSMTIAYYYLGELFSSVQMVAIEALILTIIHYVFEELWKDSNDVRHN